MIAETNRRHLASNKLAKRTSKKVAGACERWPSWSLFSGATRCEGLVKGCPDALSVAHEATGWVKVPGRCYKHWLAVGTSKGGSVACPAHRHSLEGAALTTGAYEGSLFAEGVSVRQKVSPFHGAALAAGSVVFLGLELHSLHSKEAWCSVGQAKASPPRIEGGRRRRHQRFDRAVAVGRKRPRLARLRFAGPRGSTLQRNPPKRSPWRETTVYLGSSLSSEWKAARRAPEPGG